MKDYTLDQLIYLRDKYERLEKIAPIATRAEGPCGHWMRGYYTFPACGECMRKEIERRKEQNGKPA